MQLEASLVIKEKAEDDLRQEAAALEEAGEELEDELLHAREEVEMLAEGMRKVSEEAEEKSALQDELAAAREEISMLESGMASLKAQLG